MIKIAHLNLWGGGEKTVLEWFINFIIYNQIDDQVIKIKPEANPDILLCSCCGNLENVNKVKAKVKIFFYGENLNRSPYKQYQNFKKLKKYI